MSGAAGAARSEETDERAGKVLSKDNEDKLTQAMTLLHGVMSAAGVTTPGFDDMGGSNSTEANSQTPDGEERELEFPDIEAFRAAAEERGWSYDDDWAIWSLTSMIQSASCYLLYEGGEGDYDGGADQADDEADAVTMKTIISQLTALLDKEVAEAAARKADPAAEGEERDSENETETAFDLERRKLRLMELETTL